MTRRPARGAAKIATVALLAIASPAAAGSAEPASAASVHTHTSPDGHLTVACTCRPATAAEALDLTLSPDGWVQEGPRESFSTGEVPLPLAPDWVGDRNRAVGGLVFGDADHDGDLDLAVGTYYANSYPPIEDYYNFIYLNEGGTLQPSPGWISVDQRHTTDLFFAKINADDYPDLFSANGGSSLQPSQVFYGLDGLLPTVANWVSNDNCWSIDAAPCDFDGDGDLDVATANQGNTNDPWRPAYLFRNDGNGLNPNPYWASNQVGITNSADWADMNGDGRPDLAVSGWVNWQTGVFLNTGDNLDPNFAWTTGHPERTDKGIGWSDVDGDLDPDLAVGGNGNPDWLFGNEGGWLSASPVWQSQEAYWGCQELVWVDIDNDGDEDLATVSFGNGHTRIYLNEGGTLSTSADWVYDSASSANAIAFGDINGDGGLDLAIGVANGPVMVFLNTLDPTGVVETAADMPRRDWSLRAGPNPFRDRLTLTLEGPVAGTLESVALFDLHGRRVLSMEGRSAEPRRTHTLSFSVPPSGPHSPGRTGSDLSPGVYFARATGHTADGRTWRASARVVKIGS